jgi:hypothetical protein
MFLVFHQSQISISNIILHRDLIKEWISEKEKEGYKREEFMVVDITHNEIEMAKEYL